MEKESPVGFRMLKEVEKLEDGPLKENVGALEFVYVGGISKMGYGEARSLLSVTGIDTRAIKDILFVGGSICSLLTEKVTREGLLGYLRLKGTL